MKNLSKILSLLLTLSAMVLTLSMVSDYNPVEQWALCATGGLYVLDYLVHRRWRTFRWQRIDWALLSMMGLYLIILLRNTLDGFPITHLFAHQLDSMAGFVAIALIGILGVEYVMTKRQIAYTMVLTCISVVVATLILCMLQAPVPEYWCPNTPMEFYHARMHHYIGSHMAVDLYMNIALLFAILVAERTTNKWERVFFVAAGILIATQTLLSDGRSGMLATLFILGVMIVRFGWRRFGYKALIGLAVCITLACVFVSVNGRFYMPAQINHDESSLPDPRLSLWKYTYSMIRQHPLLGHGYATLEEEYIAGAFANEEVKCFYIDVMDQKGVLHFDTMAEVHPHNTYLLLWLEAGLLAPIWLLLIFVLACVFTPREDRLYVALFAFLILWQALFDSFSSVFSPCVICWFLLLWLRTNLSPTHTVSSPSVPRHTGTDA